MKIAAFCGSPRKNGGTSGIIKELCEQAEKKGYSCTIFNLYDYSFSGCHACNACKPGTEVKCIQKDDMQKLYEEIILADCIILGSPVYFGQITGPLKTFLDRWCCFFDPSFNIRKLPGKKYITVVTSAAKESVFCPAVNGYLNEWLGNFFKMTCAGNLSAGGIMVEGPVKIPDSALKEAEKILNNL